MSYVQIPHPSITYQLIQIITLLRTNVGADLIDIDAGQTRET